MNYTDPPPTAAPQSTGPPKPTLAPASDTAHHADPEEVDISQHYYAPQTTNRVPTGPPGGGNSISEDQLRQMMLGFDPAGGPGLGGAGGMPGLGGGADGEDPMMKMLQQMMGGGPGGPGGGANPFGPGSPFGGGIPQQQTSAVVTDRYSAVWRLLHTAVALGLGLYIALCTSFAGTRLQRVESSVTGSIGRTKGAGAGGGVVDEQLEGKFDSSRFFWAFATAEAVLLTTRYFLDRARGPAATGMVGMAVGLLPPPFKGYVEIALRYVQVFGTVRSDVLVCVFVLGVCSWLRG